MPLVVIEQNNRREVGFTIEDGHLNSPIRRLLGGLLYCPTRREACAGAPIPDGAKVDLTAGEGDNDLVAAPVVVVSHMEGLVKVADEVDHELERIQTPRRLSATI